MIKPNRTISFCDLLDDVEAAHGELVALMVTHDGINDFYDSEDIEFIDSELYERTVQSYEVTSYTKHKVGLNVELKGV